MDEAGTGDPNAWGATTALFAAWKPRADRAGEPAGTMKRFISNIEGRGLSPERRTTAVASLGGKLEADLYGGRLIQSLVGRRV